MSHGSALIFRCDATPTIGIGHVKRCLALAAWARQINVPCYVVARFLTESLKQELLRSSVHLLTLPPIADVTNSVQAQELDYEHWLGVTCEVDASDTRAAIAQANLAGVLVVDHYGIDHRWESRLRSAVQSLVVIDDLANRTHDCDLLLDQTLGRHVAEYAQRVPSQCTLLLGTDYALLRPEFAEHRLSAQQRRSRTKAVRRIFVSLGGTDAHNLTERVLQSLLDEWPQRDMGIDVVLSRAAPHFDRIVAMQSDSPLAIRVHEDASDIAVLMVEADLAIGAAGTMAWERACLGLPTVMLVTADNQRDIAQALAQTDAVELLGDWRHVDAVLMAASVRQFCEDPARWQRAVNAAFAICDGQGARRVLEQVISY